LKTNQLTIISGGQCGVDRAALDFALQKGMGCGGWCPKGRKAEDGTIPERYPLKETPSEEYSERTKCNVDDSEGILIIYLDRMDEGTEFTLRYAKEKSKPVFLFRESEWIDIAEFNGWLNVNNIKVLNVVGPRESNAKGAYEFALNTLEEILTNP
jgi:hypothetical protein